MIRWCRCDGATYFVKYNERMTNKASILFNSFFAPGDSNKEMVKLSFILLLGIIVKTL
jgi:hypothetical protein